MKTGFVSTLAWVVLFANCLASQKDLPQVETPEKLLRLQYAQELETKVLKVGPAHEISIGQFALQSFSDTSSRLFSVSSLSALKSNDPLEPGAIVLHKVQVDRSLEFEEGTTKFHHATFASIVEFLVVSPTGEPKRILGHSEQITSRTLPFSAEDTESKGKIVSSIQSAVEEGLKQIVTLKEFSSVYKSQKMFQR